MAKLSRPDDACGALGVLNWALHDLHARASEPSLRDIAKGTNYGVGTIHRLFAKAELPKIGLVLQVVEFLAKKCRKVDVDQTLDQFDRLWQEALSERTPPPPPWSSDGGWPDDDPNPARLGPRGGPLPLGGGQGATVPSPPLEIGFAATAETPLGDGQREAASVRVTVAGRGGVGKSHLVGNESELRHEIREALATDNALFLGISAPVVCDELTRDLYFLTQDSERDDVGNLWNSFSYRELQFLIANSPASRIVLVIEGVVSADCGADATSRWVDRVQRERAEFSREVSSPSGRPIYLLFGLRREGDRSALYERLLDYLRLRSDTAVPIGQLHRQLADAASAMGESIPLGISYNRGSDIELRAASMDHRWCSVAYAEDGTLAIIGRDRVVRVWNAGGILAGSPLRAELLDHDDHRPVVALDANGALAMAAGRTVRCGWHNSLLPAAVTALALSPDGTKLAAGLVDGALHVWDAADGAERRLPLGHASAVRAVAIDNAGHLASAGDDRTVRLWNASESRLLPFPDALVSSYALAISLVGVLLLTASHDGAVRLWNVEDGSVIREWRGTVTEIAALAMSSNIRIAVVAADGAVHTNDEQGDLRWRDGQA